MSNIDIIYDHYKETCELSRKAKDHRNKLFVSLCALEALSFMSLISPNLVSAICSAGIGAYLDTTLILGNTVLQTFIWILIAYVTIRYCQETLYVERSYSYIGHIEEEIIKEMDVGIIREGRAYQANYPVVLNLIDLFYMMFCPVLFICINGVRIYKEWIESSISLALLCDTAIFIVIFIMTWFYFLRFTPRSLWSVRDVSRVLIVWQMLCIRYLGRFNIHGIEACLCFIRL